MHIEDSETRERIIEVATVLFATQGYRSVSSRKICAQAQANHAAINYYFRNKENLYLEVLKRVFARSSSFAPMPLLGSQEGDSRKQFEQWIAWYLERLLTSEDMLRYWQLVSRELQEPSEAFTQLVSDLMQPVFLSLEGIVRRILPPIIPTETVRAAALSIISQCLIYLMGGAMIEHLLPSGFRSKQFAQLLASHITTFSLAGLDALGATSNLHKTPS
jgi:TetR/AcrR family transcriptional regulator, regulator of cefoperazone and chloramphenicol sensitivity